MSDWKLTTIEKEITNLKKEEKRQFLIAYASLDPKYHGYIQAFPQKIVVLHSSIEDETLKKLLLSNQ